MESMLLESANRPAWDDALMHELDGVRAPAAAGGGMSIGVRDGEGHVYRVVRTSGLCETVRVFERARELGFGIDPGCSAGGHVLQRVLCRAS
jgi:hypothetical protein